jgi:hypothetical protein
MDLVEHIMRLELLCFTFCWLALFVSYTLCETSTSNCANYFLYNLHGNLAYSEETSKRRTWIRVLHWPCAHSVQQSHQEACLYNTFRGAWWRRLPSRCFPQRKANWPEILDSLWHGLLLQGDRCTQSVRNQAVSAHSDDRFREACGFLWEHQQSPKHNGSGQHQLLRVSKSSAFNFIPTTSLLLPLACVNVLFICAGDNCSRWPIHLHSLN